jgi:hypothetical protein
MTDDERRAIEQAATDYFDSWFEGDPQRMAHVLHPHLAKRRAADSGSELVEVPADDLIQDVAGGPKTGYDRTYEIRVMDIGQDMASVVVHSDPFTEYLHLGRFDDGWKIVNAYYRRNPRDQTDR